MNDMRGKKPVKSTLNTSQDCLQNFKALLCWFVVVWIKYGSTGLGYPHTVLLTNGLLLQSVSVDFPATSFADSVSWNKSSAMGIVSYPHV